MSNIAHEILIVESDRPTAELYRRELSREYCVFTCADERAALDLLGARPISAIVLEPALSGGQGWRIFAVIKEACGARPIPIIVCSTLDERRRGADLGAVAYLVKPVSPATLRDALRRIIRAD